LRFPFLGRIPASGKSIEEFEAALVTLLADGYLKQPRVAVTVKEFVSLRVFVTGEVRKPGAYGLRPDRSLLALLEQIGELTETIGHEVVVIRPPGSETPGETDKAQITRLSLRDIRSGNPERDFRLSPGDTVFFPKAAQVYVTGQVAKPGAFRFEEGMTVYQALNLAGGINERGSSKVKIARIVDGQRTELKAKPGDLMLPEDTLIVPERFF
jgi:polysaccharide export outer membrane protein